MASEKDTRIQLLRDAAGLKDGLRLVVNGEPETTLARELLHEGLALGDDRNGEVMLTGIRDSGREFLAGQTRSRRLLKILKKVAFAIYSLALLVLGYLFSLDSVKDFFSDLVERFLPK
jgi:hypothetical protein